MQEIRPKLAVWVALAALAVAPGCSKGGDAPSPAEAGGPPPSTGPVAVEVTAERDGLVYRYLDPSTGVVTTATSIADIPESARGTVVLFDTLAPPPAGWDLVADLSRGLPATAVPRQNFTFPIAERRAPASAREVGAREVVLFATSWCGYCERARAYFKRHRVPFTEIDLERDGGAQERLAALGKRAGVPESQLQGVPIIFVDDQAIVGWDQARLKRLLAL